MKTLLTACLIAAATTTASAQTRRPERVIRDDGALVLTDGASYYRFKRDSSFDSGPIGLSGRTITGRWRQDDDTFIIEGRWGWINGQSAIDDYRRMTIRITHIDGPGTIQSLPVSGNVSSVRVHRGYYYIDDIMRIPRPAWSNRMISVNIGTANREIRIRTSTPGVAEVRWCEEDDRCALEIDYRANLSASARANCSSAKLLAGDSYSDSEDLAAGVACS